MKFHIIPVTSFQQNCSLVWCEHTGKAALIDPGGEPNRLLQAIQRQELVLEKVLLTHGHLDHVGAAREIADQLGVPVEGPQREDKWWLDELPTYSAVLGLPNVPVLVPDRWLEEGDKVEIGTVSMEVLHCPGHTPGHVVFHHSDSKTAFVGDVLFRGSIGRTDFPHGNHPALIHSIRSKLWSLGGDVRFVPGHGPMSTFGEERRNNPFVGD